ncbi:DNA mismatch repair protein MSH3, partial [Mucuna pruriens]
MIIESGPEKPRSRPPKRMRVWSNGSEPILCNCVISTSFSFTEVEGRKPTVSNQGDDLVVQALALTIRHLMEFGFERIMCSGASLRPVPEMTLSANTFQQREFLLTMNASWDLVIVRKILDEPRKILT